MSQAARRHLLGLVLCAFGVAPAAAQPATPSNPPPMIQAYRSAFEAYKPYTEQGVAIWRDSNDTAARIGGWRTYAREARTTETSPPPAASAASQPGTKP
jgi:hypothetical protein